LSSYSAPIRSAFRILSRACGTENFRRAVLARRLRRHRFAPRRGDPQRRCSISWKSAPWPGTESERIDRGRIAQLSLFRKKYLYPFEIRNESDAVSPSARRLEPGARGLECVISTRQTKLRLAHAINGVIARRRPTQDAAAAKLGVNQPKAPALANIKLDGFSVERLMIVLTALDQDVEIVIRKKPRSRAAGRISVAAG
jgi:predicted XRE-type DNA-binding protein